MTAPFVCRTSRTYEEIDHRTALMCATGIGTSTHWRKLPSFLKRGVPLPEASELFINQRTDLWKPDTVDLFKSFMRRYMDAGYFGPTDKVTVSATSHVFLTTPYSLLVRAIAAGNVHAAEVLLERGAFEAPDLGDELQRMLAVKWNLIPARGPQSLEEGFRACVDYRWETTSPEVMSRLNAAIMRGRMSVGAGTGRRHEVMASGAPVRRMRKV